MTAINFKDTTNHWIDSDLWELSKENGTVITEEAVMDHGKIDYPWMNSFIIWLVLYIYIYFNVIFISIIFYIYANLYQNLSN
jgi:hypothetical protein